MKICFLLIVTMILTSKPLFAYEDWSMPNLRAPSLLEPFAIVSQYQHQFQGKTIRKDWHTSMLGIADGADINIGVRAAVWRGAQVYLSYDNLQMFSKSRNEFTAGTGYALLIPKLFLRLQMEGEIYSYASFLTFPEKRKTGFFIRGCIQNDPFFDRVSFIANIGYGFNDRAPGVGLGVDVAINETFGVYGSFFPAWYKTDTAIGQSDIRSPYTFGVRIVTYGHQFFIFGGNAVENGSRHLMRGTSDYDLRLGFVITRLFSF